MSRKLIFLGVLALVLAPGGAFSLGLGDIRLNSYLNQPLDAEIALSLASGDELQTLTVGLASREAFDRYGLLRPAFLDNLEFQVVRGPGGPTVKVSSGRPIVEPFVTFLLEARWAGGRVLREYTVLLDPPVYMPGEQAAPAVEAPAPTRSAPLRPAAPVSEPRATPAPAPVAVPRGGADYGPVQRNETLWAIAERVRPDDSVSMNQMMIALFRANPGAFDGNVNRLRAGAILRMPSRQEITSISRGEASAEFRRQTREWREEQPRAPAQARLELVPPAEAATPAAPAAGPSTPPAPTPGAGAATADTAAQAELLSAVQALRGELDETRRMMEIKDAEIAALQARLAELEAQREAAPAAETEVAVTEPAEEPPAEEEKVTAPAEPEKPPVAAPEEKPAPPPVVTTPSFMDRVLAFVGSLWFWVILGLVLIAGAALHFARNRGEVSSLEEDLAETGTWGTPETPKAATATAGAALSDTRKLRTLSEEPDSILVDERQTPQVSAGAAVEEPEAETEASEDEYQYPFEDTIAGETGINLDQSDPLAEADFHMAYGLYDQAAEITKKAIEREPDRYDLRRKLVDICFVWGNADEFLSQAKALKEMGGEEQAADWGRISIMGSQICPDEEIFQSEGPAVAEVDVSFEADETAAAEAEEEWLDFDVGAAEEESIAIGDTQEQPALDESKTSADSTAELNIEDLGIDLDLGATGEHALQDLAERAPEFTDETAYVPAPEEDEGTADSSAGKQAGDMDDTVSVETPGFESEAESPVEDSGESMLTKVMETPGFDEEEPESPAEDGGESMLTKVMETPGFGQEEPEDLEGTVAVPLDDSLNLDDLTEGVEEEDLAEAAADDEATRVAKRLGGEEEDETAGGDDDTQEMPPVTMSEVGTKLDLARAYIDMGDPDGAKSILEEVLAEGDDAQQAEARELIDSLG